MRLTTDARWLSCVSAALLAADAVAVGTGAGMQLRIEARAIRPAYPLLIRNEHGALLKIEVAPGGQRGTQLQAIHVDLGDTDDLNDLAEVQLFAAGPTDALSLGRPLGKALKPARRLSFPVNTTLGTQVETFWLSARLKPGADLSHRVAARSVRLMTAAGQDADVPISGSRQRIGVALRRSQDDGVHTHRIPVLATTPRGTLLSAYDLRRRAGRDLQEDIDIGLSRSTDGGRSWEPVRVIMDMGEYGGLPQSQNGCSDPGLIVDPKTGEISCFAVWMNGKPGKHQWNDDGSEPGFEIGKSAQFMRVRSTDDGRTWSKPENLTRILKRPEWWLLAPAPQQGISLPDGTLVMPAQGRYGRPAIETFATIMVSRDHGKNWTVGEPAFRGANECQAAMLSDGRVMLNMRNDHDRFRAVAVTSDLGRTWSLHPTHRKALIEPNCNGSLMGLDVELGGRKRRVLVFTNPFSQVRRSHQTLQVSFDDGNTWPSSHHWLLDEGRGAGYPSLSRVDRDHIGIVYEGSQSQLVFERIPIRELLLPHSQRDPRPPDSDRIASLQPSQEPTRRRPQTQARP